MEQSGLVELTVRLEAADYRRASYAFLFRGLFMRVLLVFAALGLLLSAYSWLTRSQAGVWGLILTSGLILPSLVLVLCINVLVATWLSFSSNKVLREEIHYCLSDTGITNNSASSNGYMGWANIRRAVETKHDFLLFISRNQTYMIPKRAFGDKQDIAHFKSLLSTNLGSRAKLRKA